MGDNIYSYLKLTKLSEQYQVMLVNFDCIDDSKVLDVKESKRKKLNQYSEDINEFLINEALQEQNGSY